MHNSEFRVVELKPGVGKKKQSSGVMKPPETGIGPSYMIPGFRAPPHDSSASAQRESDPQREDWKEKTR
jgi:hypothetical protein